MLPEIFLELLSLHVNRTIASLDFLEAGKQKGKYHFDRLTHLQFPLHNNFQMANFLRARS
jgi:hypothetical protein